MEKWFLTFFIYCFLGWVWEVCYVSACQRKLTNRGFLFGPFLPIYGFGAIIVLFATLPFEDNLYLVYFFGMLSATLLEVVTGFVMERTFKVRYWDYSQHKYNYKGYICLSSSIAWGFFSIILVKYINAPIQEYLSRFTDQFINFMSTLILIVFTIDVTKSVQSALDLRKLLETIAENNSTVGNIITYVEDFSEKFEESSEELTAQLSTFKENLRQHRDSDSIFPLIQESLSNIVDRLSININFDFDKDKVENDINKRQELLFLYSELKEKIVTDKSSIKDIDLKDFKGAVKLLRRNPSANSELLQKEIEQVKKY